MPDPLVVAKADLAPPKVPPAHPGGLLKVTVTPDTGFPLPFLTWTWNEPKLAPGATA